MRLHRLNDMPWERMNPRFARKVVHSERTTVARLTILSGAIVPMHQHENEQISVVLSGRLRFFSGEDEWTVAAGEVLEIPPNLPHGVEAMEDSDVIDIFAPVRSDWLSGNDAYLR